MLGLLYIDELKGYLKSKAMLVLFVGLPLLSMLMYYLRPDTEGIPLSQLVAILIASIGGTLAAVLLSTSITAERGRHVYDMFLVRPVRKSDLLLAKFFGMLTCLLAATLLSLMLALIVDSLRMGRSVGTLFSGIAEPLATATAAMAVACSVGILFGTLISSVAVSAILAVYAGNQMSGLIILPAVLIENLNTLLYTLLAGVMLPAAILTVTVLIFRSRSM